MTNKFSTVSRITTLIAGIIATTITLLVPFGYFYVSRQYIDKTMAAENELTASSITGIVANNPKTWRFEEIRVSEILHRRISQGKEHTSCCVKDMKGMVVAELVADLPPPVIVRVDKVFDAGVPAAQVELSRSLQPLVERTVLIAILSGVVGAMVFLVLRLIPMRAVTRAYQDLTRSELRYRSLYTSMREGLGLFEPVHDQDGRMVNFRLVDANPTFEQINGRILSELLGASGEDIMHGAFMGYIPDIAMVMSQDTTYHFEYGNETQEKHYDVFIFAPTPDSFAALIEDITIRKRSEEQIYNLAYFDTLTQLPNRFLLQDRLGQLLARASREQSKFAILFLDLDRFKHVNDTLGHAMGDQLLVEVAHRLSIDRRKSDTISRLGGDEFVVLAPFDGDETRISHLAEKLVDRLAKPITIGDRQIYSGTSIGISIFPADGCDAETLIKNADLAMYTAKESGRNTYCYFTENMNIKAAMRMEMDANIRRGLKNEEFFQVFQPVIDISTNRVSSAETLIRWRDHTGKLIMPGDFIPIAEEGGLILSIGDWILKEACRKIKAWEDAGRTQVRISVNVSARQFAQRSFLDFVRSVLDETGITPRYLEIELTESSLMVDPEQVENVLNQLKKYGLSIAIDDFGTGYSSLGYLKRFPIDRLKIDRSFVQDVTSNANDQAITETIIVMAHKLGMAVVVEGVETAEQVDFFRERGCNFIQGYYFHRPMEEDTFLKLIGSSS